MQDLPVRPRLLSVACAALAAICATACGSSSNPGTTSGTTSTSGHGGGVISGGPGGSSTTGGHGGAGGQGGGGSSACPTTPPSNGDSCDGFALGAQCNYGSSGTGIVMSTECQCAGNGSGLVWSCGTEGVGVATSSTSTSATTSTSSGGPTGDSVAMLDSSVPSSADSSQWLRTGQTLDPSTLVIVVDDLGDQSCASPNFDGPIGTNHALAVIGLPTALQTPGTYTFPSDPLIGWGSEWLGDSMGNGGGGSFPLTTGSIQVISIDASTVVYTLSGMYDMLSVLDGQHTAVRCQ